MRFGILSLAIVAIASLTDAHADQRVALVIGNSAYQHVAKLPNPVNDAQAVAALFKRAGFDVVESRLDLDAANLKRAMRDFTDMARDADVAVVYYAGHGIEVDGNNYLIPVDAVLERDVDVDDETVSVDRVMRALDPVKRLRLVILDACRDNPFTRTMKRTMTSRAIGRGLAKMEPLTSDTLIAFAAKAGSTAMDGDGKNSPFTRALVKHLATPDLDLRMAFGRVRDDVMKATSNRQEPFVYGSLGGSVVSLLRSPDLKAAAPADPTSTNLADMRRDYEFFERAGTKEAWETFLELYPSGPYAVLARGHIARLSAAEKMESGATHQTAGVQAKSGSEKLADPASAPIQVATGTTDVAISRPAAPPAPGEITRLLQIELRRVGCLTGSTDGSWNTDSRRALELFNKYSGSQLDAKVASIDALDAVKLKQSRVCTLECERGYRAEGERCVKTACQSGYVQDDDGDCVRVRERAAKRRSIAEPEKPRAEPRPRKRAAAAGGSANLSCGPSGCQASTARCSAHASLAGGWLHGSLRCR